MSRNEGVCQMNKAVVVAVETLSAGFPCLRRVPDVDFVVVLYGGRYYHFVIDVGRLTVTQELEAAPMPWRGVVLQPPLFGRV